MRIPAAASRPTRLITPRTTIASAYAVDLIVARTQLPEAVAKMQAGGAVLAGMWAHEALRMGQKE